MLGRDSLSFHWAWLRLPIRGLPAVLTLLAGYSPVSHSASIVEYCPPYSGVAQLEVDVKQPFLQYSLSVVDQADGRHVVTIVADDIRVDVKTLGALIRNASSFDPAVAKIVLQARRIRVAEHLALVNASIVLDAQEVVFEDGAAITLLPDANSRLTIFARRIELASSGFRHFDVRARVQTNGSRDTFADIATLLEVRAESLTTGNQPISEANANSELARRFTRYPISDFTPKLITKLGPSGLADWIDHTRQFSEWPKYSVAVLRSAFKVAPFSPKVRKDIVALLDEQIPVLEKVAHSEDLFDARSIRDAARAGTDLLGNGPAFAPNRPLGQLLKDVADYEVSGKKLAALDFYIDALAEASNGTPIPQGALDRQVGSLNDQIRQTTIAYQNTNNDLVNLQAEIKAITDLIDTQRAAYAAREKRLKEHAEELQKGKQERAQIISGLSTAAAIATTAYTGNPQTGAAVGGVIYAVGNSTEGKPAFESLSAGYQFASAIQKPLESVNGALGDLKSSRETYGNFIDSFSLTNITIKQEIDVPNPSAQPGQPQTTKLKRDDALRKLGDQATKLNAGLDDLLAVYKKFTPAPSPISSELEEDDSLKQLASNLSASLDDAKLLAIKLDAVQRTLQEQMVLLASSSERAAKLASIPAANEARRKMLGTLALEGARDELADFVSLLDSLRRVSIVEFRAPLPVAPGQIQNAYIMERVGQGFDPTAVLDAQSVGQHYIDLLKARKLHVTLLAGAVGRASKKQLSDYVESQGRTPYISYPTEDFVNAPGSSARTRRFFQQLNQLLAEQFSALKDPARLGVLQARQLELPFDLRRKIDQRNPARLLQVALTGIEYSGTMSGGDLVFRVEVERVGNLRKASRADGLQAVTAITGDTMECFSVDLRPKTTPFDAYFLPSEFTVEQIRRGGGYTKTKAQSFWYLTPSDPSPSTGRTMMVTYPPAEARMYVKVRMDPDVNWAGPPVISRLKFTAEIFQ